MVNYCIYCDYELAMSHVKVINGRHVSLYDIKNVGDGPCHLCYKFHYVMYTKLCATEAPPLLTNATNMLV